MLTEEQIEEIIKCARDPIYYLDTFGWLDGDYGITQFNMGHEFGEDYFYQRQILKWLIEGESVATLKNRRAGLSWIGAGYAAWGINFHRSWNGLFVSIGENESKTLLKKAKFILKNPRYKDHTDFNKATPADFLVNKIVVDNEGTLTIGHTDERGKVTSFSAIHSLTTTPKTGRGEMSRFTFIDEACYIRYEDEVLASVLTTTALSGQFLMGSNAGQSGTTFYDMCMKGRKYLKNKKDRWIKTPSYYYREVWPDESGIKEEAIQKSADILTKEHLNKEWYLTFISSGSDVFDPTHLELCYKPPDLYPEVKDTLEDYRMKVKGGNGRYFYYSGVDSIVGKRDKKSNEMDNNVFIALTATGIQAFCEMNKKELSQWAGKTENVDGQIVNHIGIVSELHAMWPGICAIEEDGPGHTVINRHVTPIDGVSQAKNITTRQQSKVRLINQLQIAIESHAIVITDEDTYLQLTQFKHGGKPGTFKTSGDDDCVMALSFAWDMFLRFGGFPLDFTSGSELHNLKLLGSYRDVYQKMMEIQSIGVVPTIEVPTVRLTSFGPDGIIPDPRFLPNPDLVKILGGETLWI